MAFKDSATFSAVSFEIINKFNNNINLIDNLKIDIKQTLIKCVADLKSIIDQQNVLLNCAENQIKSDFNSFMKQQKTINEKLINLIDNNPRQSPVNTPNPRVLTTNGPTDNSPKSETKVTNNADKSKNRLADVVQIVKNLNTENAELTDRVNELTERVESLEVTNKTLTEQLAKLETIQKADIASMRTLIEVLRKELEEFKFDVSKQREDDEESEV